MNKKLKKFLNSKGGLIAIISTIALIIVAGFLIIIGVIYGTYNGNWGKIGEVMSSDFAITCYIIFGLIILFLLYVAIIFRRNKEI